MDNLLKKANEYKYSKLLERIVDHSGVDLEYFTDDSDWRNDLGFDSLDQIEAIMNFEYIYHTSIPDSEIENVGNTVLDVANAFYTHCINNNVDI